MAHDLETIFNKGQKRTGTYTWYKQPTPQAPCPVEKSEIGVAQSYWSAFGCKKTDTAQVKSSKMNEAKRCASERMADMYVRLKRGEVADRGHVYLLNLHMGLENIVPH